VVLDITDATQLAALEDTLPQQLDAVVNNAGVVVGGPVEAVPLSELRRQLEVNVVGQAAVTQAVLPRLRRSRGRVVFVSSVSGLIATPMTGPYNASKFALEAMADSLRMEVAPWGIRVILVEPAQTDTDMWRKAEADLDRTVASLSREHRDLYAKHIAGFRKSIPRSQRMATSADGAAAVVERALTVRRPRARYIVGRAPRIQAMMAKLTPTPALDAALRAGTGVPRRP
jgi:NAD(P)-dependent dehydrogenase (short-subunit alcohol dehydrogenase family)